MIISCEIMSSDLRGLKGEAKMSTEMKNNSKRHQITTKWDKMSTAGKKTCLMSLVSEAVKDRDAGCILHAKGYTMSAVGCKMTWERHEKATGLKNVNKTALRCNTGTWIYNCQMIKKGRQTNKCKRTDSKWARKGSQWQQGSNKRLLDSCMISIHQKKKNNQMDEKWMSNNVWKDMQDSFGIHHLAQEPHRGTRWPQEDKRDAKWSQTDENRLSNYVTLLKRYARSKGTTKREKMTTKGRKMVRNKLSLNPVKGFRTDCGVECHMSPHQTQQWFVWIFVKLWTRNHQKMWTTWK